MLWVDLLSQRVPARVNKIKRPLYTSGLQAAGPATVGAAIVIAVISSIHSA